jgi:exopolyphosphatase/guanosine-5'-triphosphate,3'-diphosphate pyrophosphatase
MIEKSNSSCRLAAIDVGTNSVLLTVAEDPGLSVVDQQATVTRLGQGVDRTGRLHPDAVARTLACLTQYRDQMDRLQVNKLKAVGTSALRDAEGGDDFLSAAEQILGVKLEVISGVREAQLTFSGALVGLFPPSKRAPERAFVFDIGGGSTELILGHVRTGEIEFCTSLNVGSVRLTERFGLSNPPTHQELTLVDQEIQRQLASCEVRITSDVQVIGVAGTVTTLYAIETGLSPYDSSLVHGAELSASQVGKLAARLSAMTVEERLAQKGLTSGRADVIAAGARLCSALLEFAGAPQMLISDGGVRFGLLKELSPSATARAGDHP